MVPSMSGDISKCHPEETLLTSAQSGRHHFLNEHIRNANNKSLLFTSCENIGNSRVKHIWTKGKRAGKKILFYKH
jgi:hypothetical protein